jgi:hypothetical protein
VRKLPIYGGRPLHGVLYLCEDIAIKNGPTRGACLLWSARSSNDYLRYKLTPLLSAAHDAVLKVTSMKVREDQAEFGLNKHGERP